MKIKFSVRDDSKIYEEMILNECLVIKESRLLHLDRTAELKRKEKGEEQKGSGSEK